MDELTRKILRAARPDLPQSTSPDSCVLQSWEAINKAANIAQMLIAYMKDNQVYDEMLERDLHAYQATAANLGSSIMRVCGWK